MIDFSFESSEELNEETLIHMADNMASAATTFDKGGYDEFLQARESFKEALRKYTIKKSK